MTKRLPQNVCKSVDEASSFIKTLANPNRLAIVCSLMEAPRTVTELEQGLGIPQPTLSQQLTLLRDAGIIVGRRSARVVTYRIGDARVLPVVQSLRLVFSGLSDLHAEKDAMDDAAISPDMFD
ncbi:metalloregulator ArsR/SmtB family transcription factor [Pseudooceanicola sp. GBMRC 2024]|uniref:Metalloregulator ArsR/SmtB family transcription factor n=1 Tax=Pseudooceanicola albus TaxID=2692189 RepID=A0A6L7G096_9RHOB|nr:metalloregulator ArsR/SmtB family transcription factor [Pseudooceanicola albus]